MKTMKYLTLSMLLTVFAAQPTFSFDAASLLSNVAGGIVKSSVQDQILNSPTEAFTSLFVLFKECTGKAYEEDEVRTLYKALYRPSLHSSRNMLKKMEKVCAAYGKPIRPGESPLIKDSTDYTVFCDTSRAKERANAGEVLYFHFPKQNSDVSHSLTGEIGNQLWRQSYYHTSGVASDVLDIGSDVAYTMRRQKYEYATVVTCVRGEEFVCVGKSGEEILISCKKLVKSADYILCFESDVANKRETKKLMEQLREEVKQSNANNS